MSSPHLLDNTYHLETPEGAELWADLAGPIARTLAFSIDFCIRMLLMIVVLILAVVLSEKLGWALVLLAYFLVEWWYPVLFELYWFGQTPGKRAMGIRVVRDDLTAVTFSASLLRNLLRFADFLPSFYTFGYCCMALDPHSRRLGDIAAGTLVICDRDADANSALDIDEKPRPSPFALAPDEQGAIVEFTVRRNSLSSSRQEELADIIKPLLPESTEDCAAYLRSVGAWLLGKR